MCMGSIVMKALSLKELVLLWLYRNTKGIVSRTYRLFRVLIYIVIPKLSRTSRPLGSASSIFGDRCASHSSFADHDWRVRLRGHLSRTSGTSKYPKMRLNFVPYSDRQGTILQVAQEI